MNTSLFKIFAIFVLGVILFAGAASVYTWHWLNEEREIAADISTYIVPKGASLHSVAKDMQAAGAVSWPRLWVLYARFAGLTAIKAGEYQFQERESPLAILLRLNDGKVVQYQVTLLEGNRFSDFVVTLQQQEKLRLLFEPQNALLALQQAGVDIDHPEGWFYPDTYQYTAGDSDLSILLRAHEKMKTILSREWLQRDKSVPYKNVYEALIMASIIEKETGVAYERGQIAGVFVRRLEKGMRLQTDPTVIYGMGDLYMGNITRKDLRTRTLYNTYLISGLPPTPIANPGVDAIRAALHPEPGDSLYFVAKGDGSHVFSSTLEDHNRAVIEYQKKRRSDYRSSPGATPTEAVK